jgi:hypothetical protein
MDKETNTYTYTMEYYSTIKNEIMLFSGKMDGTGSGRSLN